MTYETLIKINKWKIDSVGCSRVKYVRTNLHDWISICEGYLIGDQWQDELEYKSDTFPKLVMPGEIVYGLYNDKKIKLVEYIDSSD